MIGIQDTDVEYLLLALKSLDECINEIPKMESKLGHRFCETLTEFYSKIHHGISEFAIEMTRTSFSRIEEFHDRINEYTCSTKKHMYDLTRILNQNDVIYNNYLFKMEHMYKCKIREECMRELEKQLIDDKEKQKLIDEYKEQLKHKVNEEFIRHEIETSLAAEEQAHKAMREGLELQLDEYKKKCDELQKELDALKQ